jgi:hypothetical protein
MDFVEAFESRGSRRAFLRKQVDQTTLEKILTVANRCPSYMNTQPWELYVVAGKEKDKLANRLFSDISNGVPRIALGYPDLTLPVNQYRSLRRELSEFVRWHGFLRE